MVEQVCTGCGRAKVDWRGNGGQGYVAGGLTYCCAGCARGSGCTCDEEPD